MPSSIGLQATLVAATLGTALLAGCASSALLDAEQQSRTGQYEQAYATLDAALRERPDDPGLRTAHARARDRVVVRMLAQAELSMASGRIEEAQRIVGRATTLDSGNVRLAALSLSVERALRDDAWMRQARRALDESRPDDARPLIDAVLKSQPDHAGARAMRQALPQATPAPGLPPAMAEAYQRPVTLEFRDAQLRQVFEALARTSNVNFVFDKDVRADARVTVFLRNVSLDEALRVILATQQMDRKLLNDTTVLVFPNTAAKQREHQELITRSLYLANADVKQAVTLVRTMTKTRDLHADERLNALVVRDVPEVVAQIEKLLATIDLREPEVMLAVEVMEVASDRLEELGLSLPGEVQFGIPNAIGQISLSLRDSFRGSVANPAALLSLRGSTGSTNLLANPTIRARNREKAKVQIGEKLPVFTTTSTANVGVSSSVSYLDVGLKLDIEPSVQSDGDVVIRLSLEVSNLLKEVPGPQGSIAYQVGTRLTTTSLRLRDGETQVLAGLISDEDRRRTNGVPGLSELPLLGRLFGSSDDSRAKTEIVMLITPRVVYGLQTPERQDATMASGTDAQPGALPLRLRNQASAGVGAGVAGAATATTPRRPPRTAAAPVDSVGAGGTLSIAATEAAAVGETVSVTLANRSGARASGELEFDPTLLQPVSGGGGAAGRLRFDLAPQQDAVFVLRVLAPAAGQAVAVAVARVDAADGTTAIAVEGSAQVQVKPKAP